MRVFNLPGRVLLVALAAILPFAIFCAVALNDLFDGQRAQTRASTLGVARALATSIDGELRLTISALQALALTDPLGGDSLASLADAHALASAVRASHPEWRGVLLSGLDGTVIFSTENPFGATHVKTVEADSLAETIRTGQPVIGQMAPGARGNLAFAVRVPVRRNGGVIRVLTAIVRPEAVGAVLGRQRIPAGWTVSVFDANQSRVARSFDDDRFRGQSPSPTLQTLIATMGDGADVLGATRNVDGTEVQTAVVRLDTARWLVALGAATSLVDAALRRTLLTYGGGLALSLCISALVAWWMSRAITRPMARLRENAGALGQGRPVAVHRSGIAEVDAVSEALARAASERALQEAEREQLLTAERAARTDAQAAGQRLQRLVSVSAALSRSLEERTTLEAIAEVVVPDIADICRIDLLDDDDVLQRKLTRHADPQGAPELVSWVDTHETLPDRAEPLLAAVPGLSAGRVVPLVARGRTIGAMTLLQADSQRHFSAEDGALIGELAQRAALALDNVRLLGQARKAQTQAEVASKAKDEFLAMLGHELRNPLAPIALAVQLIARRDPAAFPRERQIIERQVKHLSRMVDDLLDVSRIVSGKIVLKPEPVDLRDVVSRALELTLPAMQQRAKLPTVTLPEAPAMVRGDLLRLAQIIGNLLNNAAKFTEPDGAIVVTLETQAGEARVVVADRGIGIEPALLPHVFERFVQGQQPLQRAAGGLGLGLAIARSLATLHGGTITAASPGLGEGSTFALRLPLAEPETNAGATDPAATAPRGHALRLLLVDDNEDAAEVLADWFRLEGHGVRTAHSAEQALHLLAEETPDAAVFDIGLPDMSGYELARRVRADVHWHRLPLVALTGYGQETDKWDAIAAGFDAHFAKPAHVEQMLVEIHRLVQARA